MRWLIANWKMNGASDDVAQWVQFVDASLDALPNKDVAIAFAPPAVYLENMPPCNHILKAAQDLSAWPRGAYTGDVSAEMLKKLGVEVVLVGHSERRLYAHETGATLAQKVVRALEQDLIPLICVGETLKDREAGHSENVVSKMLTEALALIDPQEESPLLVAYEPVWAIGTNLVAEVDQIQSMHRFILNHLDSIGFQATVLYGGSVNASNAQKILLIPEVGGLLVGGASLSADSFTSILDCFSELHC
jgi:triosephosphate isomerase